MSDVMDIVRKKRVWPHDIDGDVVHIRPLKQTEQAAGLSFKEDDSSFGYVIGIGLAHPDGSPVFLQLPEEDPKAFGDRVLLEADMPVDTRTELTLAILRLSNGPTQEQLKALKKKLNGTRNVDSQPS